jgi:hypothetical protein
LPAVLPMRAQDLGNVKKGGGRLYKGRGLLQLTGRANYAEYGKALGVDLENNPAMPAELSLKIAREYWKRRKLHPDCDRDDIRATTRRINGGLNGLEDRSNYIRKAKEAIARIEGIQLTGAVPGFATRLHRRSGRRPAGDAEQAQVCPRHRSGFRRGDRACRHAFSGRQEAYRRRHRRQGNLGCDRESRGRREPVVTSERISCT